MKRSRISGQVLLAAAWLTIPAEVRASANLFERASTCPTAGYNQCSGLPSGFCCSSSTTCLALAGNTTVLCCPTGSDCSTIATITCDISLQNATAYPNSTLKTTELSVALPTCNGQCCPFGFSCSGTNCVRNKNQESAPSNASSTSATTSSSSSAGAASSTSTNSPANLSSHCNKFPTAAILVGFFPGLALGVILTALTFCILNSHKGSSSSSKRRSGSSFGNISEPRAIMGDMRTDFLRKAPQTPSSTAGSSSRMTSVQRVRSLFHKPSSSSPRTPPSIPRQYEREPVTPVAQREPSFEDINIFTDGDTASALRQREQSGQGGGGLAPPMDHRHSHQTTFSEMMGHAGLAGLHKGQPFVYKGSSPANSPPPRSREI